MHVGQSEVASLKTISQFLVIEAELLQQRRVQVMHVYRIACDVVAEFVRLAIGNAALDAAAGSQTVKQRGW